jgi:molybdenum cofactor cytidylyltransferase
MAGIIAQRLQSGRPPPGMHWCLVLAAGGSRRLGRPKQFVSIGGRPLVELACLRALATRPAGVVVVTGAHGARTRALLARLPVVVVRNAAWREGMAGSLRAGLGRIPSSAPSVLVTTVDQWRVVAADLRRVVRGSAPAAAAYDGARGVPALLPRRWRAHLLALRGDRGARTLLGGAGVRSVTMPSAAFDLDTPQDLAALCRVRLHVTLLRESSPPAGTHPAPARTKRPATCRVNAGTSNVVVRSRAATRSDRITAPVTSSTQSTRHAPGASRRSRRTSRTGLP